MAIQFSHIPKSFVWNELSDCYAVELDYTDATLMQVLIDGHLYVHLAHGSAITALCAITNGSDWSTPQFLKAYLSDAGTKSKELKTLALKARHQSVELSLNTHTKLYTYGAYRLEGRRVLLIFTDKSKMRKPVLSEVKRDELAELFNRPKYDEPWGKLIDGKAKDLEALLLALEPAAMFHHKARSSFDRLASVAGKEIDASRFGCASDGCYQALSHIVTDDGLIGLALMTEGIPTKPTFTELRWATQKLIPSILRRPLFENSIPPALQGSQIFQVDLASNDSFENPRISDNDYDERLERAKGAYGEKGFEALAWYASYHTHSEASWGIYIDSKALEDAVLLFSTMPFTDRKGFGCRLNMADTLSLLLAMVLAHERFHARVDAALTWHELQSGKAKYAKFKDQVYKANSYSPEWREEALANYAAWEAYQQWKPGYVQRQESRLTLWDDSPKVSKEHLDGLDGVVSAWLDFSPEGYNKWRLGCNETEWNKFGAEIVYGKPFTKGPDKIPPLKSVIAGDLPYDFSDAEVPVYLVGAGSICDAILADEQRFGVPSKRELEKALKHFGYELNRSAGKGGHQKWTGASGKAFTVPTKDPVSRNVFSSFLKHFEMDKKQYVQLRNTI